MITAKVKSIEGVKPFESRNGMIYYHKLVMDNGDVGEIGKKKNNAYQIGDEITYTIDATEYGNKFKEVFQGGGNFGGGGGKGSKGSSASFALSYAKDLAVANIGKSDKPIEMDALADKVINAAGKFQAWLKENE